MSALGEEHKQLSCRASRVGYVHLILIYALQADANTDLNGHFN